MLASRWSLRATWESCGRAGVFFVISATPVGFIARAVFVIIRAHEMIRLGERADLSAVSRYWA
ncbi:hypothetical protein LMTR13_26860 [Bradyrhizobium icense]|uniref:Uncharacterized protein n=1 Tax=Bradyrhizobium icense TaxID=1274631 RepID=A0A1B1UK94_9BRAD|nr:hypothetical protein LMTR13_26860 [Bradyrhizobium icense]